MVEGVGAITGLPILQEIGLVLAALLCAVCVLIGVAAANAATQRATTGHGGGTDESFAAIILSDAQRRQMEKLVLPEESICLEGEDAGSSDDESAGRLGENAKDTTSENSSSNGGKSHSKGKVRQRRNSNGQKRLKSRARRSSSSAWADKARALGKSALRVIGNRNEERPKWKFRSDKYRFAASRTPLLVFVNRKSGGQNGDVLLEQLRGFLPEWQVWDIGAHAGPELGLRFFEHVPSYRVLVAGGDGTAAWVLETLDRLAPAYRPPLAVLPVGTGNDMARVLGWGGGLSGSGYAGNGLAMQLLDTTHGRISMLDRWKVELVAKNSPEEKDAPTARKKSSAKAKPWKKSLVLNNYLGIGVDAQISLNFHLNREAYGHLFTSRLVNKYFWYTSSGGQEILLRRFADFSNKVDLECDGELVPLPAGTEGLIILNIGSYGGGVNLWGADDDEDEDDDEYPVRESQSKTADGKFRPASFSDGLIEVLSVASSFQLGAAQVGLARPTRLCQCSKLRIRTKEMSLPLQVDGEPFMLPKTTEIDVDFLTQSVVLCKGSTSQGGTDKMVRAEDAEKMVQEILDWATNETVITFDQKHQLRAEFSKRMDQLGDFEAYR